MSSGYTKTKQKTDFSLLWGRGDEFGVAKGRDREQTVIR